MTSNVLIVFFGEITFCTMLVPISLVLWDDGNQSYNLYNNSLLFYCKISTEAPIETKQETFQSRIKGENYELARRERRADEHGVAI